MSASLRTLKGASVLFIVTWFIHTADHLRRGTAFTEDGVIWAGNFSAIMAAVALTLVFTDHPSAPFVAAAVFASVAVGVSAVHLAPGWGWLSEPLLFGSTTDGWSVIAVVPEIIAAAWASWVAFDIVRANDFRLALQ